MNESSNTVVRNGVSVQELELNIMIKITSNNTRYTCTVSDGGEFMESQTITIRVDGNTLVVCNSSAFFKYFTI